MFNQFLLAEYLVRQTMAARGHMNGWPAVGGTGWSAQRGSLPHQIFRYGNNSKKQKATEKYSIAFIHIFLNQLERVVVLGVTRGDFVHILKEKIIGLVLVHQLKHKVHRLGRIHIRKKLAQDPDSVGRLTAV